ncbi:OmpW family outer membrane protein [Alkalimonas delamerensis]|uniref:OmpW family outer membrane protein n=1 Tax=Alkalimonas delamerensis TaxID=265981 RepID=A0ABT9GSY4_9GAMM|nr:OmpW family outer membrane protein [Alkalimonas delamerensis]MDP4529885.1 OmpW family outer membrane protein [Alkalimonas delamerensis]
MRNKTTALLPLSALTAALFSPLALANFSVNVGAINVSPNDDSSYLNVVETVAGLPANSAKVGVNSNTQLGLTFDYALDDHWSVQLIAATPFSHNIRVKGSAVDGLPVGKTKHLPPTLLAQYNFGSANADFRPFVGAGVNYTVFFSEKVAPELVNTLVALEAAQASDDVSLSLKNSVGIALQAGFNYKLSDNWGLHAMIAWADIDTDAKVKVNGTTVQPVDVSIDPTIVMVGLRYSFR